MAGKLRFTNTDKWFHPTWRTLPIKVKLFFFFYQERCDHAGFWVPDFTLASFLIGETIDERELLPYLGEIIIKVTDSLYFCPSYLKTQYPTGLNPNIKPHLGAIRRLKEEADKNPMILDYLHPTVRRAVLS